MDNEEYYQYFKKYVELRDQNKNKEAYELNKQLVEELGLIEANQIQFDAEWDYALLKAKRFTETKAQLTKEELEDVLIKINHQAKAKLFKELYQQDRLSFEAIQNSLVDVYVDSENFDQMFFLPLFKKVKEEDDVLLVSEEDKKRYESLPNRVVIYRGMREGENIKKKLSYTLSFDKAVFFADRHSNQLEKGVVVSVVVNKCDILAVITQRDEDEVIIDPNDLGEITVVQDSDGPANRPYVGIDAYLDGDSDLVILYQASDEETYNNCYENYNWDELKEGWTTDLKQAKTDALYCASEDEEDIVILLVKINKKYLTEYHKSSRTFSIDFERASEDNEDFEDPSILCISDE